MATYINRHGEQVEVSDEHIEVAIRIKEELQKASPSRRCSWSKHKKMMQKEGFDDSDTNEGYRCLIKSKQIKEGTLPSVVKHVDMITDTKLESIKEEIGEIRAAQLESRHSFLKLNRIKRELTDHVVLLENIDKALAEKSFVLPEPLPYQPKQYRKAKTMIAVLSDIHFGAIVDVEGYTYNPEIASELLSEYAIKLLGLAEKEGVTDIQVVNIGDLIEHDTMRPQNTYAVEKTWSEQVVDASELIIQFLTTLTSIGTVRYSAIAGNHDRTQGAKGEGLYGDSAINISNKIIETFVKYSGADIIFEECDPYHYIVTSYGRDFLFVHGDKTPLARKSILAEQSQLYGINFDALIGGHIHHNTLQEVGNDQFIVTFGSLKGVDEYSLKTIGSSSCRSQGQILVDEDGNFEFHTIKFKY